MSAKRLIPALVIAFVLSGTAVSQAQIPVTDVVALVRHIADVVLQTTIRAGRQLQAERLYKMSLPLSVWTSLTRYITDRDLMPEWRIHNWFTDDVLYAKPYNFALTYGDATGDGYTQVSLPRQDAATVLGRLDPAAAASVRADLALIDLADSAIIRGTHETGRLRFNGRAEAESIIAMQDDVTTEDGEQSLAAALDKVSASALVQAQNRQARGQFEAAILEQLILEQAWDRNADVAHMNMVRRHLAGIYDDEERLPSVAEGASRALNNWRLP